MKATSLLAMMVLALRCGAAEAGTVINSNLPAGTSIVNIDARADGAAAYSQPNPPQAFWFQPTPTAPSLTLQPGTYRFRIIDSADAHAQYPALTSSQLSEIYTAWTYNSPWTEDYLVFNSEAVTDPTAHQLFDGALAPGTDPTQLTFSSAQAAYDGTIANGYFDKIRPAPPGRAGDASSYLTSYTFSVLTNVLFVIPDNILSDNAGGVSVVVTEAAAPVPAPAAALPGSIGMIGVFLFSRRRNPCPVTIQTRC